jgi:hypothetical protein
MDFSILDSLVGAATVLAGMAVGSRRERHRHSRRGDPQPVCGCGHHASMHTSSTGPCNEQLRSRVLRDPIGICKCQRYTGPEPLPEFYA